MKVLKSLLAILVPALLLVSCGFVKTAEDKILEVYSAQLKSQGYQDILDAYTLKAETVNSPERDQYVGKIIFLKADGTEENSLPISCNLSTGQVALKPLIPDDELGRLYRELRDDAPLAMQIAAESVSLGEEEGAVVGSVSFTTTVPSDAEEPAAPVESEPAPEAQPIVPAESASPAEEEGTVAGSVSFPTTAPSDMREPKVRKKLPTWAKALIWIVASVLAFLLLFAIGARLFPDFFDSILYSHEELDIIRF